MKAAQHAPNIYNSIAELNKALGLPAPLHPLVSLNRYELIKLDGIDLTKGMMTNLYKISYKKHFTGKVKYGQQYYDFNEGGICFVSPNQVIGEIDPVGSYEGFSLMIHPDFFRNYPLAKSIKNYGFFSYSASEALHLSEKERETIIAVFQAIEAELQLPIDQYSQDVIVTQIELLLNYSNRYYNRQFITRKAIHHDLLDELDKLLNDYFDNGALTNGLPSVQHISDKLHVSQRYLSDMLRQLTGQNTQQHIHNKLIDKAKEILSTSKLTIAEIAYQLGFEHPQSFNKLFKNKTNVSPLEFRQSFN